MTLPHLQRGVSTLMLRGFSGHQSLDLRHVLYPFFPNISSKSLTVFSRSYLRRYSFHFITGLGTIRVYYRERTPTLAPHLSLGPGCRLLILILEATMEET